MNKLRILVVDDSEVIRKSLTLILKAMPFIDVIDCAEDVPCAEKIATKECTDVIILDIRLKQYNGIKFLKWVKERYPGMRVIMFTNNAYEMNRQISYEYGAEFFLDKTREFDKLQEILFTLSLKY